MNWVFEDTLQLLEHPQSWAANARDTADAWVFVKLSRMPFCYVEEIDPDDLYHEMTDSGEYECFLFAEIKNRFDQSFIGWVKADNDLWKFLKKSRMLKLLFCRKSKCFSERSQEPWQSAFV